MFVLPVAIFGLSVVSVNAFPLQKRIAQTTIDSVTPWEDACNAAGGGQKCNPIAVSAAATLLAAAGPCEQQDSGDDMVDLAKQLNRDADMIRLAQIFVQQPRNSPTGLSVEYCTTAPKNTELNGLFQCQFESADKDNFTNGVKAGGSGTIPFGLSSSPNPAGSCPANPDGPVPDGKQLNTITQDPGSSNAASGSASSSVSASAPATSSSTSSPDSSSSSGDDGKSGPGPASSTAAVAATAGSSFAAASAGSSGSSSNFKLQNGKDAQALNAKFVTLTADSSCTDGDNACVSGAFAMCVSGKFVTMPCSSGLTCAALPLVNSAGTSVTCTTQQDAEDRIAATGATGGVDGSS